MPKKEKDQDRWAAEKKQLKSKNAETLVYVANHLLIQRDPELIELLLGYRSNLLKIVLNKKTEVNTRLGALKALAKLGLDDSRKDLDPIFDGKKEDMQIIEAAASLIFENTKKLVEAPETVTYLIKQYETKGDWSPQHDAVKALRYFSDSRVGETLMAALKHDQQPVRSRAAMGLAELGIKESVPLIIEQLKADDLGVTLASRALDILATPEAIAALSDEKTYEKVLQGANDFVHGRFLSNALAQFRLARVDDDLIKLAQSEDTDVSANAVNGLIKRKTERAIAELAPKFLKDSEWILSLLNLMVGIVTQLDEYDQDVVRKLAESFSQADDNTLREGLEMTDSFRDRYQDLSIDQRSRLETYAEMVEAKISDPAKQDLQIKFFIRPEEEDRLIIETEDPITMSQKIVGKEDDKKASLFSHIQDQDLKNLYALISREDYSVFLKGQEVIAKGSDPLAVLEAMHQSLENIISDLDEHGEANESLYDDHNKAFFEDQLRKIEAQIKDEESHGKTSTIFAEYKKKHDKQIEGYADEFMAEMDADENLEKKISHQLMHEHQAATEVVPEVPEILGEIKNIKSPTPTFINMVVSIVNNQLVFLLKTDPDFAGAEKVARAYIDLIKDDVTPWIRSVSNTEIVGNLLAAGGMCKKEDLITWTIDNMIKDSDLNPRLNYNLACSLAVLGNKEKMIEWIKKARAAGKPTEQFENDSDFDAYKDDPDFKEAIK